jgi:cytochrome P450
VNTMPTNSNDALFPLSADAKAAGQNVDITRKDREHLTLVAGPHAWVAAGLIRMAAVTMARPMLQRFGPPTLARPVEWRCGSGYRFAKSLRVSFPSERAGC